MGPPSRTSAPSSRLGWAVDTELLPAPDVLARITPTGRRQATPEEHALATAAPRRPTDRDPCDTRPVPAEALAVWRREDGGLGVPSRALPHVPPDQRGSSLALRDVTGAPASTPLRGDEPPLRSRLEGVVGPGHVQVVLRTGYGTAGPATRRLPVDEVLDVVGP